MTDLLAPLVRLEGVEAAFGAARAAVDSALGHPKLRRQGGAAAVEAGLRSAHASAALAGRVHDLDDVRAGTAIDPVVQGALRVSQALEGLSPAWPKSPRQVLAKLHILAGKGIVPDAELGRPVSGQDRLDLLAGTVVAGGDSLVLAAIVHGELLALGAFGPVNGVVARAAGRLSLIAGGLDVRGLIPVDVGHYEREPEYLGAAGAFATGTQDGLRSWLKHYAAAITRGAEELRVICDGLPS